MKKRWILILSVPIILVASYLDLTILGRMSFKEYLFQCSWEYAIFWMGVWFGFQYKK